MMNLDGDDLISLIGRPRVTFQDDFWADSRDFGLLMSGDIEEQVGVLRRRIFGSVGSGVAHDHEDRLIGISMLGLAEEGEGAVRDQVGEVILCVVKSVLHLKSNQKSFLAATKKLVLF